MVIRLKNKLDSLFFNRKFVPVAQIRRLWKGMVISVKNTSKATDYMRTSEEESLRQKEAVLHARELVAQLERDLGRQPTCCVTTFGCQMNARDSEKICGILLEAGYQLIEEETADFVIYNTCTVRDNANQRVYGRLGTLLAMKKKNPAKKIALCGCMMQESAVIEKILKSYSQVDLIFGTHNIYKFAELLCLMLEEKRQIIDIWEETDQIVENLPTHRKYPFKSGINIMFGCNNFCSYCIVPYVRGRERSRASSEIIDEIRALAAEGVVEVMLLGQNVNSYGKGLSEDITFAKLLQQVEQIEGIRRIRFMTSHPKDLSDELIAVMRDSKKICRHLHLPLQSGSSRILEKMNRRYDREAYLALVKKLRAAIPDLSITTDIIVGFPGETKEDVDDTIRMITEAGFDNAFTFIYSKRTGTPAATMESAMSEKEISEQFDRVLKTVQDTARQQTIKHTGKTVEVLVEEVNEHDPCMVTGRLSNNLLVHFPGGSELIGTFCTVKLVENKGFYFIGEQIG